MVLSVMAAMNEESYLTDGLAILCTCKRIHSEAKHLWLSTVTFRFFDIEAMQSSLSKLPWETLGQIRHVIINALLTGQIDLLAAGQLNAEDPLSFMQHLRLDMFTIYTTSVWQNSRVELVRLMQASRGWRELRFVLKYPAETDYKTSRKRWPTFNAGSWESWDHCLRERDGEYSQGAVKFYRVQVAEDSLLHSECDARVFGDDRNFDFGRVVLVPLDKWSTRGPSGFERPCLDVNPDDNSRRIMIAVKRDFTIDISRRGVTMSERDMDRRFVEANSVPHLTIVPEA